MIGLLALLAGPVLELRLKQGDAFDQSAFYRYVDSEEDLTMEFRFRHVATVTQTGSQYALEVAEWLLDTVMDGSSIQNQPDRKPRKLKRDLGLDGALVFQQPAPIDPTGFERVARVLCIVLPRREVKPGDSWTRAYPAGRLPAAEGRYRLEGPRKVTFEYREISGNSPIRATGSAGLAVSGWPSTLSVDLSNVKIPGGDGRLVRLHVEVKPSGS